jgi:hypothetical protein
LGGVAVFVGVDSLAFGGGVGGLTQVCAGAGQFVPGVGIVDLLEVDLGGGQRGAGCAGSALGQRPPRGGEVCADPVHGFGGPGSVTVEGFGDWPQRVTGSGGAGTEDDSGQGERGDRGGDSHRYQAPTSPPGRPHPGCRVRHRTGRGSAADGSAGVFDRDRLGPWFGVEVGPPGPQQGDQPLTVWVANTRPGIPPIMPAHARAAAARAGARGLVSSSLV